MVVISPKEFESRDVRKITNQLFDDMLLFKKCMAIADYQREHLFHVVNEVAEHIAKNNTDYVYKKPEGI